MIMENVVTEQGRSHLEPIVWRPMELMSVPINGLEPEPIFSFAEEKEVVLS